MSFSAIFKPRRGYSWCSDPRDVDGWLWGVDWYFREMLMVGTGGIDVAVWFWKLPTFESHMPNRYFWTIQFIKKAFLWNILAELCVIGELRRYLQAASKDNNNWYNDPGAANDRSGGVDDAVWFWYFPTLFQTPWKMIIFATAVLSNISFTEIYLPWPSDGERTSRRRGGKLFS